MDPTYQFEVCIGSGPAGQGEATFKDPHTLIIRAVDSWREITARNIVIAVGTVAAPSPGMASAGAMIVTSDDIVRLPRIPRNLTVVGAGVIGIEHASSFAALGVEVTLVEKRRRPLEFLDEEIVDELLHQLRKRNVTRMRQHFPIGIYALPGDLDGGRRGA